MNDQQKENVKPEIQQSLGVDIRRKAMNTEEYFKDDRVRQPAVPKRAAIPKRNETHESTQHPDETVAP